MGRLHQALFARVTFVVAVSLCAGRIAAQIPSGYYATVDTSTAATLRATLHQVIDDHVEHPYTSSATDTWDILESAQQDPNNSSRIIDVYRNASFTKRGGGNNDYNREHSWPKSYGFPDFVNYGPYTDCHALWLCFDSYNTARSNKPFEDCNASHSEEPTLFNGGIGGGTGTFPGNSNWTTGSFTSGRWQVWGARKGDIARSLLYLDVRYEGGVHNGTGRAEIDLRLTDNRALMSGSNTGQNEAVGYMGLVSTLLQWHLDDPVDAFERRRNDVVFSHQQNRNPFIDHPEWIAILWGLAQPGTVALYGTGCSAGPLTPVMSVPAGPSIGAPVTISMFIAPPSSPAALHLATSGPSAIDLSILGFAGCTLLAPPEIPVNMLTNPAGTASLTFPVQNDPFLVGLHFYAQWLVADPARASIASTVGADLGIGG